MKKLNMFQFRMFFMLFVLCFLVQVIKSQSVVYQEDFGVPTASTVIQSYTGWQNGSVHYSGNGTCDVRTSSASNGYGQASGGGNVMINDTVKWFMVSGLNTLQDTNLSLFCGLRKTTAENGSNFVVEVSSDSLVWTRLSIRDTLPVGTGTAGWYRVCFPNVPSAENLHIRFSNLANVDYRLDDIALVVGEEVTLETVETPTFSVSSGTYYEPLSVTITCATPGAAIYYTMDGTTPTTNSSHYLGALTINNTTIVKALAIANGMYDSPVATVNYVIQDTNSVLTLPFDISTNSTTEHQDIALMDGFRGFYLGSSYADGSVKFESSQAGKATLVAHLDSAPDKLSFDMKGKNGGSGPAAYEGISMEVSQSVDGQHWSPVSILTENDILVEDFIHFTNIELQPLTRYVRWKLMSATKGNTQLNNIKITKMTADSVSVLDYNTYPIAIFPNPTSGHLSIQTGGVDIQSAEIYSLDGRLLLRWEYPYCQVINLSSLTPGMYILHIRVPEGLLKRKVVRY